MIRSQTAQFSNRNSQKLTHSNTTYGKPSKPRSNQPSMYQILSSPKDKHQTQNNNIDPPVSNNQDYQHQPVLTKQLIHTKSLPNQEFKRFYVDTIKQTQYQNLSTNPNQSINLQNSLKKTTQKLKKKVVPFYKNSQNRPRYMQDKKTAVQKLIQSPEFDQEKFEKMKQEQIKRFKQTSRDLSNTAFLTYFNKPPFQNYGRQNKHSLGLLYGDYMYSHNVFPHTGQNHPKKQQTYVTALTRAKSAGNIRPHTPMTRHLEDKLISEYLTLGQIYPKNTTTQSIPIRNQTVLQKLPAFNYVKPNEKKFKKYSPYLNANQNQELFKVQNHYLKRQQVPRYFSNKDEIEGKEITYLKKIEPCRK